MSLGDHTQAQLSNFFSVPFFLTHPLKKKMFGEFICCGCSKEPSHRDGSFEHPQHMFWFRNKKNNFNYAFLSGGLTIWFYVFEEIGLDLILYSIITPFDTFEISCIWKYYGKCSICSKRANAAFSIFSLVFKTRQKFQCCLKIENDVMI